MSFIDDIVDIGKSAIGFLGGSGIGSQLARTALIGYGLNQVTKSINRQNNSNAVDKGVRLQIDPSTDTKIPVIYGEAFTSGAIIDAEMTNSNQTMYFCIALCEKTGTKLSDSQASEITFKDIYWNDSIIVFQDDGITADYTYDRNGTKNENIKGLVKVYLFNNGSTNPVLPELINSTATLDNAYDIMPSWTTDHTMDELVFVIVRVDYNKEKNITGLAQMDFAIRNTMTLPGDCLYDYLTNTRYGAGVDSSEISV